MKAGAFQYPGRGLAIWARPRRDGAHTAVAREMREAAIDR